MSAVLRASGSQADPPRLCPIVEGVLFTFFHAGQPVRGIVLSDVLESVFGIDHRPAAWLAGFLAHESEIVEMARRRFLDGTPTQPVLVRETLFPAVRGG
jgi:hypothetical protein